MHDPRRKHVYYYGSSDSSPHLEPVVDLVGLLSLLDLEVSGVDLALGRLENIRRPGSRAEGTLTGAAERRAQHF